MINIFDLHNDYFTKIKHDKQKDRYIKSCFRAGLKNICTAVWTTEMEKDMAFECIARAKAFSEANNIMFAVEDLHFVESHEDLNKIIELKPAYVTLTWNHENRLGGGAHSNSSLTEWGKTVVRMLEENNIQIDTAHMNERSFMEFSCTTQRPIFCSHTAFAGVNEHPRNLKDYQIKIIAETNGTIGLAFVKDFLTREKKCTVNDIINHIEYFVNRFGIQSLALGTDFYGATKLPSGINNYKDIIKIQNKLFSLGYTTHTIERLFFENSKRFFC